MGKLKLGEHEGKLCVVWSDYDYREPQLIESYYPTGHRVSGFGEDILEFEVKMDDPGVYRIRRDPSFGWQRLVLTNGGQTLPVHVEKVPVPEPKQRGKKLPTRWKDGRWEKLTARGWQ